MHLPSFKLVCKRARGFPSLGFRALARVPAPHATREAMYMYALEEAVLVI